jgi:chloramphenicol O-acetyltransferase type A
MSFHLIDLNTWERKPYYDHYMNLLPCHYSINCNLDVTTLLGAVKKQGLKFYPAFLYAVACTLNRQEKEFRMVYDQQGNLGYWDELHLSYTVFHQDDHTYSELWTDYNPDFETFYKTVFTDFETYKDIKKIKAKPHCPPNCFRLVAIPWISFTGYNIDSCGKSNELIPSFVIGKFFEQHGTTQMPFCVYIHHSIADGYHTCKLINDIQDFINTPQNWLNLTL